MGCAATMKERTAVGWYRGRWDACVCEDGDDLYILSSGAPNHPAEYDQVIVNPNTRCKV